MRCTLGVATLLPVFAVSAGGEYRRLQADGVGDDEALLRAVPSTIDVTGMPCAGNQVYSLHADTPLIGGKPAYAAADGAWYMYWGNGEGAGRWYVDSDTDPTQYYGYVSSEAEWPPVFGWREYCSDEWTRSDGPVLEPSLSADSCGILAGETLALAACRGVAENPTSVCSVACAEHWMPVVEHCGDQLPVLEMAAPGLSGLCEAAVSSILATAPSMMTVTGLTCHDDANADYSLLQAPHNGRAQYQAGGWRMYWTPSYGNTGGPAWVIDHDQDDTHSPCYLISTGDASPSGDSNWREWCDSAWTGSRLSVVASLPDAAWCMTSLDALSVGLTSTCCREEDGETCGQNGQLPGVCTVDCAALWSPYARACPRGLTQLQGSPLGTFFGDKCGAAAVALNVLPQTSVVLEQLQGHDFSFKGFSGVRYQVVVRAAAGDGSASPCLNNLYDTHHGDGQCDQLITAGAVSCATDMGEGQQYAHYCDESCAFQCLNTGLAATIVSILPPGTTDISQAVASEVTMASDKSLGFTAEATGRYTVRVQASAGEGLVSVTVAAVGTTEKRSPELVVDGLPHPLHVQCESKRCSFAYDGSECFDGDGNSFNLRIPNVQAGEAYAFRAALNPDQSGAQVSVTLYQGGAAAGADGYQQVVGGPLGGWTHRSDGHQTYAESKGCANNDTVCSGLFSFGVHADAPHAFKRSVEGTYVATASGTVLVRVEMTCDVPFYANVDLEGCRYDARSYGCVPAENGVNYGHCSSDLSLTVTKGAFYNQPGHGDASTTTGGGDGGVEPSGDGGGGPDTTDGGGAAGPEPELVLGDAERTDSVVISRADLEAHAAVAALGSESDRHPTLEQLLVAGTPEAALLAAMFTTSQEPCVLRKLCRRLPCACGVCMRELLAPRAMARLLLLTKLSAGRFCGGNGRCCSLGTWFSHLHSRQSPLKSWPQRRRSRHCKLVVAAAATAGSFRTLPRKTTKDFASRSRRKQRPPEAQRTPLLST